MAQEDVFAGQLFELRVDTGQLIGPGGTNGKILWKRPDKTIGEWPGELYNTSGNPTTQIVYQTSKVDTDGYPGTWTLQAFYKQDGMDQYGKYVHLTLKKPLE